MSIRGVSYNRANHRWRASLAGFSNGGYIGEYLTEAEATAARRAAELALDGYEHEYPDIEIDGDTARVPLMARRGQVHAWAIIDAADVGIAAGRTWCLSAQGYAVARSGRKLVFLHRLVQADGPTADHVSGDKLDCRRANLRSATQQQNSRNAAAKQPKSGLKGVRATPGGRWTARIMVDRKTIHLGTFDALDDAGHAYDRAAAYHFGEFARPNFPTIPSIAARKIYDEQAGVDVLIKPAASQAGIGA